MQKKIGTILDEELLKKAKNEAHNRHTTLSRIFENALVEYFLKRIPAKQKLSSVEMSFGAIAIPSKTVQKIAQEEIYESE